jgi:hypothetical protein
MGFYTQVPMTQEQLDAESLARQREEVELRDGVVVDSVVIPAGTQAESDMLWRALSGYKTLSLSPLEPHRQPL